MRPGPRPPVTRPWAARNSRSPTARSASRSVVAVAVRCTIAPQTSAGWNSGIGAPRPMVIIQAKYG